METKSQSVDDRQTIESIVTGIPILKKISLNTTDHDLSSTINEKINDHHRDKLNHTIELHESKDMDPYKEFEIYLAKVIEEIDDIIVTSPPTPLIESPAKFPTSQSVTKAQSATSIVPIYPIVQDNSINSKTTLSTLPSNQNISNNNIDIKKLIKCKNIVDTSSVVQYRDLLNEFGISDSDYTEDNNNLLIDNNNNINNNYNDNNKQDENCCLLNSDYDEPKDMIQSSTESKKIYKTLPDNLYNNNINNKNYQINDTINSDYDEPIDIKLENYKSSSLPTDFGSTGNNSNSNSNNNNNNKPKNIIDSNLNEKIIAIDNNNNNNNNINNNKNAKLPPRQMNDNREKKKLSSWSPMSLKNRKLSYGKLQKIFGLSENETIDDDYDDVFIDNKHDIITRSKSFDDNAPKSAPVTPTDEKKNIYLSKLLRKRHTPIYNDCINEAVLVRVASLPDEDIIYISNEQLNDTTNKNMAMRNRAISPLTLKCDVTAKRLSESDKDINQISPVKLKTFKKLINQQNANNNVPTKIICNLSIDEKNLSDTSIESGKSDNEKITEIYDDVDHHDSGVASLSLASIISRLRNGSNSCCPINSNMIESFVYTDMATQTSPPISRSSSFTWVSDCDSPRESHVDENSLRDESMLDPASPQNTVDDDNRSSSSSQDLLQSMDEISSGSISPETTDRASPLESGIGTASPPRSTDRRFNKPSINEKCSRKETWEKIRQKTTKIRLPCDRELSDVWIRRESVHTQTQETEEQGSQEAVDSSSGLEDSLPRTKPPRPTNLPLGLNKTVSNSLSSGMMLETIPRAPSSPSSASLQLKNEPLGIELGGKSNSAPLLENNNPEIIKDTKQIVQQPRSQSERQLSEIEAQEACKWLRAAGFPQYAQMYEDYQFPIEVSGVAKDHPFLETDSLQSLYRRLHALNRCANMKIDTHHTHHHHNTSHSKNTGGGGGDDSDEDTQCALSENWTFEKKTRRWSRVVDITPSQQERLQAIAAGKITLEEDVLEDRLEAEEADDTMIDNINIRNNPQTDELSPRFRRSGSERIRDSAKQALAFLRRVESLKSRRRKRQNREGVVISGPQVVDVMTMQQKMKDLNCVDVSPTGLLTIPFDLIPASSLNRPVSPLTLPPSPFSLIHTNMSTSISPFGDDSSSYCSDGSQGGGPAPTPTKTKLNRAKRFLYRSKDDQGALSDSECQPSSWRHKYLKDTNSNNTKLLDFVNMQQQKQMKHQQQQQQQQQSTPIKTTPINSRGGSLNLGKESQRYRDKLIDKDDKITTTASTINATATVAATLTTTTLKREEKMSKSFKHIRDNSYKEIKQLEKDVTIYRDKSRSRSSELAGSQESSSTMASRDSDQDDESPRLKGTVVRWHSFQRGSLYPETLDPLCQRAMASMSCGQLLVLRKLALLKLTACMERYCPTHRTGWNWELPKFIRKIKTPDYKDKTVFGVPLLLSLQRTGQALPKCIQIALRWLRANALDQVGIFRKSGVRSRIQKLKVMTETQGDNINFDGQQAFDVADLVKQYFRELPEALLTNKLSETFTAIFQHVPIEYRPDAVQCVLLLLPDEHREALETLLDFLNHVANNSPYNQMTPSNLAVCLAPSLFHFNHTNSNITNRSSSVSPRRRKTVGIPDQRELSENKAAHDCLLYLIKMHRELFMVSSDMLTQCHFNYMEESVPVALEELGSEMKQDWRGYLHACTSALLKEGREKSRGWVSVNNPADTSVDMAYKKVGDGHPLRLWRVTTEVEAPPNELLHRVLRERHIWDPQLLKYRMVNKLDANAEIFQYASGNMSPLPARDYCILRSWRTDLPKDACVIVETSVEHPDAPVMLGGTRGIVLASRYLIEKCGSGKSRIMHLSRVDTKGRTPEWYNKSYGHIAALHLSKIRNSFKHTADGPESKV
ncbi:hypothetical protein HCN44_011348 [Aphidius gifuensis]|uniref:Uncharacterized protein n=1 Tax=Aphidius gifuensis TaxID=684658 RepID=A0A835CRL5_APHGI|nr:rho GTPase-activating protein 7 isoform X2 [Aphidius gifuensis]KAF7994079.1 hypothetical protein HCN44_011348 [Aphidius gifuensis]